MRPALAGRLSRALVRCHPRRWRERYGEEMLDVLDQHQLTARTVASLAASALSTHVDPAYRTERLGLSRARLRRVAMITAGVAAGLVLASGMLAYAAWRERWQLSGAGGVGGVAFAPGLDLVVSAVGSAGQNNMDTVWDVTDSARPRQLSAFQGGEPTALSPDGRIVATVSYGGEPVLWNVADPGRPDRIAVMQTGGNAPLWGEAFSPDGQILAIAYTDQIFLWDVASAARPRLLGTLAAPVTTADDASFTPQDITFSPDGRMLASVTGTGYVTVWNVTDPARPARIATLTSLRDNVQTITFSPGGLLADVTYNGTVLVFSLADPGRPALTTTISGSRGIQLTGLCQVSGPPGPGRSRALDARRVASPGRRGGWLRLGLGVGDQVPVPHRIVPDGEFEHAVEDQPPAAGPAPVEAEAELVQVALQVLVLDRALVGAQQPALGQGGDPVDPGQQLAGVLPAGAGGPLAAPDMGITEPGDPVVAHPAVGDHRRARLDVAGEEGVQRAGRGVGQDLHPAAPVPPRLPDLDGHADQGLLALGPPAAQPRLLAADEGLIHLDRAGQPVPARAHQHRAQPVQHRPRRRVRADLQRPLQAQRRDAVLSRSEHPAGGEPHRQRRPPAVEQRARRHRRPLAAGRALVPAISDGPPAAMPAPGADEAARPPQPVQEVQAVGIGREPGLELSGRSRVVHARPRLKTAHGPLA